MKSLFLCKQRTSYGMSVGLINSANFITNYLNSLQVDSKVKVVVDANSIDKEVTQFNPDVVLIEAIWVTPEKFKELISLKRHLGRQWVVRIHSRLPFLAHEGNAIKWLREYSNLGILVAPNTFDTTQSFNNIGIKSECLPNIYWAPIYANKVKKVYDYYTVNVGCFGAIRPMKNHLIQAVAAIDFAKTLGKKLRFHINANRNEQNGDNALNNIRNLFYNSDHELVEHEWCDHEKFINLIKHTDIGLQVSLSETFNIVTADHVANNVPIVVSSQIDWMPPSTFADPNNAISITNKLLNIYNNIDTTLEVSQYNLLLSNLKNGQIWMNFLAK